MNIYIDESGSFVQASDPGKWNAVAAMAVAETSRARLSKLMAQLRRKAGAVSGAEVKINTVPEPLFMSFLDELAKLELALFCVVTDAGRNTLDGVAQHQAGQVAKVLYNLDQMKFAAGKEAIQSLADGLRDLPPQLYVQLTCQIHLMFDAINRLILYFVQRRPSALRTFRWRVDRKDVVKGEFERAFERLSPALIQTMSIRNPMISVKEFDYSAMKAYEFDNGLPSYLADDYGLHLGSGWNIGKMIRDDMQFVDSKASDGIQAVDLIVSGVRRCLRHQFNDNRKVAKRLGSLMVQAVQEKLPLQIVGFSRQEHLLDPPTSELVNSMARFAKPMLVRDC